MIREKLLELRENNTYIRKKENERKEIIANLIRNYDELEEIHDSRLGSYYNEEVLEKDQVYQKLANLYDELDKDIYHTMGGDERYWRYQNIVGGLQRKMKERTMTEKEYTLLRKSSVKRIKQMIRNKNFEYIYPTLEEIVAKLRAERKALKIK